MKAEMRGKIKYGVWALLCGSLVAMVMGFSWGGWSTSAHAAAKTGDFPAKGSTITIIVPVSPGGAMDIGCRLMASGLEKVLGVPVQVVN
ncbi:MAG: hypothetical protein V1800_00525, partial [Candidatus Latescibacterota bacterium]